MRVFLLTIFLLALIKISHAQVQIHLGATTAYNATFVLDEGLSKDPRYNSTYTYKWSPIGFNFGIDLGRKFGLSLESILSKQGQVYELVNNAKQIAGERKIDASYLNLPLLMKFMGGGNGGARANFNFGPQLSLLTSATESIQAQSGEYTIPQGLTIEDIQKNFPEATQTPEQLASGLYTIPSIPERDFYQNKVSEFKNAEFQLAAAFGLDIDLSKHLYLSSQVRANYSLTDMRNGDIVDSIKAGNASDLFGKRTNVLVGVQLGIHYTFGTTRSFKFKE